MMNPNRIICAAFIASMGFHAWLFAAVPAKSPRALPLMASSVEFLVFEEPPPPEPEPEVEPPPPEPEEPPPPPVETEVPEPPPPEPMPEAEEPPEVEPPADPPPELSGTTLAAEDGAAWSAPPGSGRERQGALREGVSRPSAGRRAPRMSPRPSRPARPALPAALPLSELSRPPHPPSLGDALRRNYPEQARQQGRGGEAKVRARIEPNGRVKQAKVVGETSAGFGDACKKTVLASKWTAPLDKKGRPAPTWVSYRCQFRVDD